MDDSYQQGVSKVRDLLQDMHVCMFTTMTLDGRHVSRPMGVQQAEFDGDLWFFTYNDSPKMDEIRVNPQVNVSFANESKNTWLSISGTAEPIQDHDKAAELWTPLLKAWFPDELETEGLMLIKVHADTAEYWDAPNSKALMLFGTLKAAITGEPPKVGENKTVNL